MKTFSSRHVALPREQQGVVLFVALIAMVILMLAGLALMRSIDTSSGVVGNLAFRSSSMAPVNYAIEKAVDTIYKSKTLGSPAVSDPAKHYYSFLQANESKNGVPEVLAGGYGAMTSSYNGAGFPNPPFEDAVSGAEVRWVIERVCNMAAVSQADIIGHCDILPPKVPNAGTDNKYKPIPLPPIPIYRVTVRADIPNTNAVSYAQAFLR